MYYSPITTLLGENGGVFFLRAAITFGFLCAGAALAAIGYRTGKLTKQTAVSGFALWAYSLFILFVTIIGRNKLDSYHICTEWLASYSEYAKTGNPDKIRDILYNLVMFIPFAFLCAWFVDSISGEDHNFIKPSVIALIAGVTLSLIIECVQLVTRMGTFDVDDLFHNIIGTLIGITLWMIREKMGKKRHGGIT